MFKILAAILRAPQSPRSRKAASVLQPWPARLGLRRPSAVLVRVAALLAALTGLTLVGCGQPGPLYLPTDPAAAKRATLPETLNPWRKPDTANASPAPAADNNK
jgi:predicted small lipoprotein YifL